MEIVAVRFTMEIVPDVLDVTLRLQSKQLDQVLCQCLLVFVLPPDQVEHDDSFVVLHQVAKMALERRLCQRLGPLDGDSL